MPKRKPNAYTLKFKLELLKEVDEKKLSKTQICHKYGIPNSSLSTIVAGRDKIEKETSSGFFQPSMKKMRKTSHEDIELALFKWFS